MTAMTSITLGLVLIVLCVLVLIWGFPSMPEALALARFPSASRLVSCARRWRETPAASNG